MKSIWIVDDDQSIRFVLEKALQRENLPTRSFTNPRDLLAALSLALLAAYPGAARAQSNEELLKELRALKERVGQLEDKLKAAEQKAAAPKPTTAQWGMTPQQVQEFNRIAVKTELFLYSFQLLLQKRLLLS